MRPAQSPKSISRPRAAGPEPIAAGVVAPALRAPRTGPRPAGPQPAGPQPPSAGSRAWFEVRAGGLRLLRGARNLRERAAPGQPRVSRAPLASLQTAAWPIVAGQSRTLLWNARAAAEWSLTAGKVHNLRVAARRLDGLLIPQGAVFSFWGALGRPVRTRGFVAGRELREGCLVASTGGGLCQLSNALYAAALEAGLSIVERHAHSQIVPGSLAERGLDATVFWNYLDLRFRAPADCLLRVELSATQLQVRLLMREAIVQPVVQPAAPFVIKALSTQPPGQSRMQDKEHHDHIHDCIACEQSDCPDFIAPLAHSGHTAWLLDEMWPEFDTWLGTQARAGDAIDLPLDGRRRRRPAYAWSLAQLNGVRITEHPALTALRSLNARLLGAQGAARQRGLARMEALLARAYARGLAPEADHAVVSLNLLGPLWQTGMLAGRRVTVLMNRSPLALLHAQLDRARALHPDSPTLGDFRADPLLVATEEAALHYAARIVTPHRAVAQFCRVQYGQDSGAQIEELAWQGSTPAEPARRGGAVLFPASALGRKGAYEVRAACRELGLPVRVLGAAQEHDGFWEGVQVQAVDSRDPWAGVACVALPAFVEHRPRLLLQARARGLAVVCSEDCGLGEEPAGALRTVRAGQQEEFTAALASAALPRAA